MLAVSDARKVSDALDASGTELAGVAITHPHPDHYAGLAQILGYRDVPIVATREVDAVIRHDDTTKEAVVGPMMGPNGPTGACSNQIVTDGQTVRLGAAVLRVRSLGPGESFRRPGRRARRELWTSTATPTSSTLAPAWGGTPQRR
jgi:glyoxylase-like metal-dependent hydrolase (beta-lactamase superfamily II)